jgi:hypothetical protein
MGKKYRVIMRECWHQSVEVEAESPDDARDKVFAGEGDWRSDELEYSHSLDDGEVEVEEI